MKVGAPDYRINEALGLNPDAPAQRPQMPVLGSVVTARQKITINLMIAQGKLALSQRLSFRGTWRLVSLPTQRGETELSDLN